MALPARLATLDGLSDAIRAEYKADPNGGFVLDVIPKDGYELSNVTGLKTALETERTNARTLNERVRQFGDIDPAVAREAVAKLDEIKNFDPDKKVSEAIKVREQEIHRQWSGKVTAAETTNKALMAQLNAELVTRAAVQAISSAKGNVDLLLPHVTSQLQMSQQGDGFVVRVVGRDGRERVGGPNGEPMTIAQLVETMRSQDAFAPAFAASTSGGAGASSGGKTSGGGTPPRAVKWNDSAAIGANLEDIAAGKVEILD